MKGETWMKKLSPKELAWVRKFEEINHRKPTIRERRAAFAQRKKALRKKRAGLSNTSKVLITVLIFTLLVGLTILVLQLRDDKKELAQSRKEAQLTKKDGSSSKSGASSGSTSSSISRKDSENSSSSSSEVYSQERKSKYWNSDKAASLADFIDYWGQKMNQPDYKEISVDLPVYWKDGSELSRDETIVDGYECWYGDKKVHRYIFVIDSTGKGKVLYSQDNSGSKYTVTETDNIALKNGFDKIIKGAKF